MLKLSDIASHAGVSPTTVSFVLNGRHETLRISEKTRNKVLEAAEALGYRSNQWARAMRTGNTKMLGLLGGLTTEDQVGKMLAGALEAADAHGYTLKILRLHAIGGSAQQVIRRISELRLMGILALHLPESILKELCIEAREFDTPVVLLDTRCTNPGITQIISDDEGGIKAGVEHLVKLGHSKIAFICGAGDSTLGTARKAAFRAAMAECRLPVPKEYVQHGCFSLREPSLKAARDLLSLPLEQRPTAIFCSGDLIALTTLQAANELNLRVPHDVSVIGFANMMAAEFATPPLTTIAQPFTEMGRTAVNLLLEAIGEPVEVQDGMHVDSKSGVATVKILPTKLIERASTAPLSTKSRRKQQ